MFESFIFPTIFFFTRQNIPNIFNASLILRMSFVGVILFLMFGSILL